MANIRNPLHLEIVPSPGTQLQDWEGMKEKIEVLLPFVESIHFDFLDGKFVDKSNFMDPKPFAEFADKVILEAHLMTDDPIQYIKPFAEAGFKRFIGQIEKMPDMAAFVAEAQEYGEAGLAIDGPTSLDEVKINLDDLDVVLIYTGDKAGSSGATLDPSRLEKVKTLREKDPFIAIEIDGGVNDTNIALAKAAGVTRFVSTGFIYKGDPKTQYDILKSKLF